LFLPAGGYKQCAEDGECAWLTLINERQRALLNASWEYILPLRGGADHICAKAEYA
jgi:hypothetical protein